MKRIISHLISNQYKATVDNISEKQDLSVTQIKTLCMNKSEVFHFDGIYLTYIPPFGIFDKQSLIASISNSFPTGIKHSLLKLCYEFALSDFNELKYENRVFILGYGKTEDTVIFKTNDGMNDLSELWHMYFDPYINSNIEVPFPNNLYHVGDT